MRGYCNGSVLTYQIDLCFCLHFFPYVFFSPMDAEHKGTEKPAILLGELPLCSACCTEIKEGENYIKKINQPALTELIKQTIIF